MNQPTCYPNLRDTDIELDRYDKKHANKTNSDTLCFFHFSVFLSSTLNKMHTHLPLHPLENAQVILQYRENEQLHNS